jgi:hypothetical protein
MRPKSVRSPSQIAPNVQRARNRALIARRRGGRFPDCLRVRKCVPGTKRWRAKCVARSAMCLARSEGHFQAEISRRENDISKEVYWYAFPYFMNVNPISPSILYDRFHDSACQPPSENLPWAWSYTHRSSVRTQAEIFYGVARMVEFVCETREHISPLGRRSIPQCRKSFRCSCSPLRRSNSWHHIQTVNPKCELIELNPSPEATNPEPSIR